MSAPGDIAIVCDSTSYLPDPLLEEHGVQQVSLYVSIAGEQRKEREIGDYGSFFERLRASDEGATTSQPSIGDFIEVYGPLLDAGRTIVSIHLASGISGTYESALQSRQRLIDEGHGGERIHVIDSRTGCGGMGMLVLAAVAAAEAGEPVEAVVERVGAAREELRMWFAIDTLEYLRRGGRIGAARAWMGSALQIKPILTLDDEITPVERVRTRRRVFERLVQYAQELKDHGQRRLGRPAHPRSRERPASRRALPRGDGLRAPLHLRDRPGHRRPHRPRPARRRRGPQEVSELVPRHVARGRGYGW